MNELFPIQEEEKHSLSYLPSPLIVASLPFKDVKKNLFERKFNDITLRLTGGLKVPYGKYGRLLLSVLTTHAVLEKNMGSNQITIHYKNLSTLLNEMQLPKQRSKDIKEQLECFANATFIFEAKKTVVTQKSLFEDFLEEDEKSDLKSEVKATLISTGIVPFFDSMKYISIEEGSGDKKNLGITIILSEKFCNLCRIHSVPVDYTIYKDISSALGKDLYSWFVYRNNSIKEPIFIPRSAMIEQFMPLKDDSSESQERVNWSEIKKQIELIKKNYYPDLKVSIASDNSGITFSKSKAATSIQDEKYVLVTSNL